MLQVRCYAWWWPENLMPHVQATRLKQNDFYLSTHVSPRLSQAVEVLTTTEAHSSKSFILCLYMKSIRAKQAKVHSAYFAQRDQHGIIERDLT